MKTELYYFSGTGNSLWTARCLAQYLGDAECIPIAKTARGPVISLAGRVGIIYPVYMFGMPLIVRRFIEQLSIDPDRYLFSIATCGGMAADALGHTEQACRKKGLILRAGFILSLPGNYTPLYGAIDTDKQQKLFAAARERLCQIADIVRDGTSHSIERGPWIVNKIFSCIYKLASPHIPEFSHYLRVNEKCTGCGVCAKVCPVNNITIEAGRPHWHDHCEQCVACLQWCPEEAIQYKKSTQNRKRYHHPDIVCDDICAQKTC